MRQWRGTPAEETTDRETVVETYLKKLEWAGIEIHRRRYRNNDFQLTTAARSSLIWPSSFAALHFQPTKPPIRS
jgi:hypothetical protein